MGILGKVRGPTQPGSSFEFPSPRRGSAPEPPTDAIPSVPVQAPEGDLALSAMLAMPVGLIVEGEQGAWINAELTRIWRWEGRPEAAGAAFERALERAASSRTGLDPVLAVFATSVASGRWRRYVLRRPDGTSVAVRVARQLLTGGSGGTRRVTYVLELGPREPEARLRQAFLAMIGHELRTPISSIVAGAELLHGGTLEGTTRDEVTSLVVEEANRVNILVEQLTALTLLQSAGASPASEPVHMLHLARRIGAREARRRPAVRVRLPRLQPGGAIALGDEGLVAQVLTILIENAAKYAAPNGEVQITVAELCEEVSVHVLDRGPGLQGVNPDLLFQLYARAPAHQHDVQGTGVGLYVASQIVAAMHGRIWAADRPGGGADFGFALPIAR